MKALNLLFALAFAVLALLANATEHKSKHKGKYKYTHTAPSEAISRVIKFLGELDVEIIAEEKKMEEEFADAQFQCKEETASVQRDIQDIILESDELAAQIEKTEASKEGLRGKITEFGSEVNAIQTNVEDTRNMKAKQQEDYDLESGQLLKVQDALERAASILQKEMEGGAATLTQLMAAKDLGKAFAVLVQGSMMSNEDAEMLTAFVQRTDQANRTQSESSESSDADDSDDDTVQQEKPKPANQSKLAVGEEDFQLLQREEPYSRQSGGILKVLNGLLNKAKAQVDEAQRAHSINMHNTGLILKNFEDQLAIAKDEMASVQQQFEKARETLAAAEDNLARSKENKKTQERYIKDLEIRCMHEADDYRAERSSTTAERKAVEKAKEELERTTTKQNALLQMPKKDDSCKTAGSAGVGAGQQCVFPFIYKGETYNSCIDDSYSGFWCATETDSGSNYFGTWGECSDKCPKTKVESFLQMRMQTKTRMLTKARMQTTAKTETQDYASDSESDKFEVVRYISTIAERERAPLLAQLASRMSSALHMGRIGGRGPFDKVKSLIGNLISKLEEEAENEADHKEYCEGEIPKQKHNHELALYKMGQVETAITRAKSNIDELQHKVANLDRFLVGAQRSSEHKREVRTKQNARYEKDYKATQRSLHGIQMALKVLREFYGDQSETSRGSGICEIMELIQADMSKTLLRMREQEEDRAKAFDTWLDDARIQSASKYAEQQHKTSDLGKEQNTLSGLESDRDSAEEMIANTKAEIRKIEEMCADKGESIQDKFRKRATMIDACREALRILEGFHSDVFLQVSSSHNVQSLRGSAQKLALAAP